MSETARAPETEPAEGVSLETQILTVTVSLLSGRSVQVPATASTALGEIREEAARLLGVPLASLVHADGSGVDEQQTLADAGLDLGQPLQALVRTTIEVGDLVKVEDGVTPSYGWGQVKAGDVGKVHSIEGRNVSVHFPTHSGWSGKLDEMELVQAKEVRKQPPKSTIDVGCIVKVREGVTPRYGWGDVKPGECGKVVSISGDNVVINTESQSGWSCRLDEIEVVEAVGPEPEGRAGLDVGQPPQALVRTTIEVGDLVKVQDGVTPSYGWGQVKAGDIGKVHSIQGGNVSVHFPGNSGWSGKLDEMELVQAQEAPERSEIVVGCIVKVRDGVTPRYGWGDVKPGECGKVVSVSGDNVVINTESQSGLSRGIRGWSARLEELEVVEAVSPEPEVTVKVALLSGRSVEVSTTASTSLREIRAKAAHLLDVRLSKLVHADGSMFDETQSLADAGIDLREPLQAVVRNCELQVGDMVRVRDDVENPRHGWGSVQRGDHGRVTAINEENATVNFPSQSGWAGNIDELELC
ncbi:KEG [Symbiodinium natans]|uniref:KEG protein n=1 Tax=Symbiodinium natans TaxID=878477 RepID=A0A812QXG8_9DINO|nr:KEG [Symbiodinium natans]